MYKVNQKIVYPGHAVATVKRIETREVGGKKKEFYRFQTQNDMTIIIPTNENGVNRLGIRELLA